VRLGLLFAVLALVSATAAVSQIMRKGPIEPLPDGRLLLVSGNVRSANFIALDKTTKHGPAADFWVLKVVSPPMLLGPADNPRQLVVEQTFAHFKIDCTKRLIAKLSDDGFQPGGRWVIAAPGFPFEPIARNSAEDFMAKVLCAGAQPPASNVVVGHAAALDVARRIFSSSGA